MRRLVLALVVGAFLQTVNSAKLQNRVVGGQEATPNAFPWQVYIEGIASGQVVSGCGAVLISDQHVLTAAQCFEDAQVVLIYLGTHNISATSEPNRVLMETGDFTVHPEFSTEFYDNDVAVITLPRPITANEYISPAKLPSGGDIESDFIDQEGLFAGWGSTDGSYFLAYTPHFTHNSVVAKTECEAHYGVDWMSDAKLCVETKALSGPCFGDAGSALIRESDTTIMGIFSFLDTLSCTTGFAVGFVRVGQYVDWINGIMNAKH